MNGICNVWLLMSGFFPLTECFWKFIYVVTSIRSMFFFIAAEYSIVWMTVCLLIYWLMDIWVSVLTITNKVPVNIQVCVFVWIYTFILLGKYLGGSYGRCRF